MDQLHRFNEENAEYQRSYSQDPDMTAQSDHRDEAGIKSAPDWEFEYRQSSEGSHRGEVEYSLRLSKETEQREPRSRLLRREEVRPDRERERQRLEDYIHEFEVRHSRVGTRPSREELDLQDALCDAERRHWRVVGVLEEGLEAQQQELRDLQESHHEFEARIRTERANGRSRTAERTRPILKPPRRRIVSRSPSPDNDGRKRGGSTEPREQHHREIDEEHSYRTRACPRFRPPRTRSPPPLRRSSSSVGLRPWRDPSPPLRRQRSSELGQSERIYLVRPTYKRQHPRVRWIP